VLYHADDVTKEKKTKHKSSITVELVEVEAALTMEVMIHLDCIGADSASGAKRALLAIKLASKSKANRESILRYILKNGLAEDETDSETEDRGTEADEAEENGTQDEAEQNGTEDEAEQNGIKQDEAEQNGTEEHEAGEDGEDGEDEDEQDANEQEDNGVDETVTGEDDQEMTEPHEKADHQFRGGDMSRKRAHSDDSEHDPERTSKRRKVVGSASDNVEGDEEPGAAENSGGDEDTPNPTNVVQKVKSFVKNPGKRLETIKKALEKLNGQVLRRLGSREELGELHDGFLKDRLPVIEGRASMDAWMGADSDVPQEEEDDAGSGQAVVAETSSAEETMEETTHADEESEPAMAMAA
jgi:hypothetical protein